MLILRRVFTLLTTAAFAAPQVLVLDDSNSDQVLTGEWFIKVYAPWCPACQAIASSWTELAAWADGRDVNIAEIDLTKNYALSNQLLVDRIPKLFHVKDGEFRLYQGPRALSEWKKFIENEDYKQLDAIPWYRKPGSVLMGIFGTLMSFATRVHNLHGTLTSRYNINPMVSMAVLFITPIIITILVILLIIYILHTFLGKPSPAAAIGPQKPRQRTLSENAKKIIEAGMPNAEEKKTN